jgi:hypothetical protein
MTPRELGAEMDVSHGGPAPDETNAGTPATLEDKIDLETWRKLERLRRPGS